MMKKRITAATAVLLISAIAVISFAFNSPTSQTERAARDKVTLCHKGKTIKVDESAVAAHLAHGDSMGACSERAAGGECCDT